MTHAGGGPRRQGNGPRWWLLWELPLERSEARTKDQAPTHRESAPIWAHHIASSSERPLELTLLGKDENSSSFFFFFLKRAKYRL